MEQYKHGIYSSRKGVEISTPAVATCNITVAIGTAPVNLADDVEGAVNVPVAAYSRQDADKGIGSSPELDRYTLSQVAYAFFNKHGVAPVVFINVLDPSNPNHVEVVSQDGMALAGGKATLEDTGILLDRLVLSDGDTEFKEDEDYVASFGIDGNVLISVTEDGALAGKEQVNVTYSKLNPDGVAEADIIGGVTEDGKRSGIELLDEVYVRFNIIPGIVIAPGYSKHPAVAAALEAKVQEIYGLTNAIALVDIDSSEGGAAHFSQAAVMKNKNTVASRWNVPCWPMVKTDGYQLYFSAMLAALMQKITSDSSNIPSDSPDNHELLIDGICLEDGTDVFMTQADVNNYLNANGIVSALKLPKWKAWGNNTAAYPASDDPINRWIKCVTMLNFMENKFKTEYLSTVGRNANYKKISSVVNDFNMYLNSLTPDHLAGGEIVFDRRENPIENILEGHLKFRTRYADYTPAEAIENEFEYDISILESALEGGDDE